MALDALRGDICLRADGIVSGFPAKAEKILAGKKALLAVEMTASDEVPPALVTAFDLLVAEAASAAMEAKDLACFVRLHEPLCEDGNNFYVGMQDEIAKIAEYSAKTCGDLLLTRVEYLEKRADMKEKVLPKTTEDVKTYTGSNTTKKTGEKTEEEKKDDQSTSTEKKTSSWEVCSERKEALLRLDTAWKFKVASNLTTVCYELGRAVDVVQKNHEKIMDPRGTAENGGGGGRMYY
jgi:hypothetical protein